MNYGRTYNFSAGPAMMPEPVLEEIRDEMMNYRGSGMCVMEMSHRSKVFQQIVDEAEADLRALMNIPDNYKHPTKRNPFSFASSKPFSQTSLLVPHASITMPSLLKCSLWFSIHSMVASG